MWSPLAVRAFEFLFRPWMQLQLGACCVACGAHDYSENEVVIMVANHVSWWDGFLLREIHRRKAPGRPLFTLMQQRELGRRPFFKMLGVYGVGETTGNTLRAVRSLRDKRAEGPFWLSVFPQGEIRPSWARPLQFHRSPAVLGEMLAPATILPVGLHLEPLNHPNPTAFVLAGEPVRVRVDSDLAVADVEDGVGRALAVIYRHLHAHGEAAVKAWPPDRSLPDEIGWRERVSADDDRSRST